MLALSLTEARDPAQVTKTKDGEASALTPRGSETAVIDPEELEAALRDKRSHGREPPEPAAVRVLDPKREAQTDEPQRDPNGETSHSVAVGNRSRSPRREVREALREQTAAHGRRNGRAKAGADGTTTTDTKRTSVDEFGDELLDFRNQDILVLTLGVIEGQDPGGPPTDEAPAEAFRTRKKVKNARDPWSPKRVPPVGPRAEEPGEGEKSQQSRSFR